MRKWVAGTVVVLVLLAAIAIVLLAGSRPESPVNHANAARIQLGMAEGEVIAVFSGPPGDYRTGSRSSTFDVGLAPLPGNVLKKWRGDEGLALIQFGPDGRVAVINCVPPPQVAQSFLDRVLDLLGW